MALAAITAAPPVITATTPPAARASFEEGLALAQQQRYREAIPYFRAATRQDASFAEAFFNLGACHERLDDIAAGMPAYEQALTLDPHNERFHELYGLALLRHGRMDRGVAVLERAAYLAPGKSDILFNLGLAYVAVTQYALAATCFETVAGSVSNASSAWYNYGLARLYAGDTGSATRAFQQVDLDAPVAAAAHYHLAVAALNAGDPTGAVQAARMAAALDGSMVETDEVLAQAYERLGDYQAASRVLERLSVARPSEQTEQALGRVYAAWGAQACAAHKVAVALNRYQQAARCLPGDAEVQLHIAQCAIALERTVLARDALERARGLVVTPAQEERLHALTVTLERQTSPSVDK